MWAPGSQWTNSWRNSLFPAHSSWGVEWVYDLAWLCDAHLSVDYNRKVHFHPHGEWCAWKCWILSFSQVILSLGITQQGLHRIRTLLIQRARIRLGLWDRRQRWVVFSSTAPPTRARSLNLFSTLLGYFDLVTLVVRTSGRNRLQDWKSGVLIPTLCL